MISEIPFPAGFTLLGRTGLSTYSILLMLAFLTASFLAPRELRRRGLNPEAADWSLLLAVVGAIVGAKLFFIVEIWHKIWVVDTGFWDTFTNVFFTYSGMKNRFGSQAEGLWENVFTGGGLVFYGGFLVAFTMIAVYLRWNRFETWRYADAFMPSLALGYAIGRLGCLVSGDGCFGYGSGGINIPLVTMIYGPADGSCVPDPHAWWQPYMCTAGVRVWNTPFIEAFFSAGLFAFYTFYLNRRNFKPGYLVAIFFIVNGLIRFSVEFLRINDAVFEFLPHPTYLLDGVPTLLSHHNDASTMHPPAYYFENWRWYGITQSQITALFLVALGATWLFIGRLWQRDPAEKGAA